FAGFLITVIEEELRGLLFRIPIEHGALLWIPGEALIQHADLIIVLGVYENHIGGIIHAWKVIQQGGAESDQVASISVPRDISHMPDVAEEMRLGATGQWSHGNLEGLLGDQGHHREQGESADERKGEIHHGLLVRFLRN
ncbi:MAG: hypothetical protein ACI8T1_002048, partial [Verrucomicrobiales bacterium]